MYKIQVINNNKHYFLHTDVIDMITFVGNKRIVNIHGRDSMCVDIQLKDLRYIIYMHMRVYI